MAATTTMGRAHHDRLVDPGHDAGDRQRQLNFEQQLPRSATEGGMTRFHHFVLDLRNSQAGQTDNYSTNIRAAAAAISRNQVG
jgi:hypothetical protein